MKKKTGQRRHAQRRAFERYGVVMGKKQQDQICQLIRSDRCTLLKKQSNRVSIYKVKYEEVEFIVVYDKIRNSLATFLPKDYDIKDSYEIYD